MEEKEKIHLKDIIEGTKLRDTKIFTVRDKSWWADRITKDAIATHDDCAYCGVEFKKDYTHQRFCVQCGYLNKNEKYQALEFKEWDGETPLVIFDDDKYFFSIEDIEEYVNDFNDDLDFEDLIQNDRLFPESLRLVICVPNYLSIVNEDHWDDILLGEDQELDLSKDVAEKLKALNEAIKAEPAVSWSPGKFRTTVTF